MFAIFGILGLLMELFSSKWVTGDKGETAAGEKRVSSCKSCNTRNNRVGISDPVKAGVDDPARRENSVARVSAESLSALSARAVADSMQFVSHEMSRVKRRLKTSMGGFGSRRRGRLKYAAMMASLVQDEMDLYGCTGGAR